MAKNKLTVFLIKKEFEMDEDIVIEDAEKIQVSENEYVYYKRSYGNTPSWVKSFFCNKSELKTSLQNSSSRALILKRVNVSNDNNENIRIFAIPFGYGKYLLKEDVYEERFGIKTVVNLIGEDNIRSINKVSISENNKRSKEQLPKESTIQEFGFDVLGDLINGITGKSNKEDFIKGNVTGTDSFQATVEYNNKAYTINDGQWYEIEKDYVEKIKNEYNLIQPSSINFINHKKGDTEKKYIKKMVNENDEYYLMDAKNIAHGGGYSKIELCDILTENKLIHIKKYAGSSVLSHLFNQGLVSAELIKNDANFINKVNEKITIKEFKIDENKKYKVVFAIISNKDQEIPKIPFFSKVSINNVVRRLKSMDYEVSIKNIKTT